MKNKLITKNDTIFKVLDVGDGEYLVIDCIHETMPKWMGIESFAQAKEMDEPTFFERMHFAKEKLDDVEPHRLAKMHERYTLISSVLPIISDEVARSQVINEVAKEHKVSPRTIRNHLCRYLVYGCKEALLPHKNDATQTLTSDEKNMRWALNKFYYTHHKNSLNGAYTMLLSAKYTLPNGELMDTYPSIHQFRYFYRKTKKMQTYYISRDGYTNYKRNNRPHVNRVQTYASNLGVGMIDATICDIYLVNDEGKVVGRPILTAMVDAYSGLCMGYSLAWEGGTYSLRDLMINVVTNKMEHCQAMGISIDFDDWPCHVLPGKILSDQGKEYLGETFSQLVELGVTIVNLPPFRPDLKGPIEKFFDIIQGLYKPYLKGKGVIEEDFQERGARDYRKDACITLNEFERIILHCILYYNSSRLLENYPLSKAMMDNEIKPYPNRIWSWGMAQVGANTIEATKESVVLSLLPRTMGKYSRSGLCVNKLHYHHDGYTEEYLRGDKVLVAYDMGDVSKVWVANNGNYTPFDIVDSRYDGMDLVNVQEMQKRQKDMLNEEQRASLQAKVDLERHIKAIVNTGNIKLMDNGLKEISTTRQVEKRKTHKNHAREVVLNE